MTESDTEHVVPITHLRDILGMACQSVAITGEPVVVQRYKRQDVMIVPLWEWRFLKQLEAAILNGTVPWTDELQRALSENSDRSEGPVGEMLHSGPGHASVAREGGV